MTRKTIITLGQLPVDIINRTLETELEAGEVVITARAQAHIEADHPDDYDVVMRYLPEIISNPTYIGQSPHHSEAFEMVRRIVLPGTEKNILTAINLTRNEFGNYCVHSAYSIPQATVDKRIAKGHLQNPKK